MLQLNSFGLFRQSLGIKYFLFKLSDMIVRRRMAFNNLVWKGENDLLYIPIWKCSFLLYKIYVHTYRQVCTKILEENTAKLFGVFFWGFEIKCDFCFLCFKFFSIFFFFFFTSPILKTDFF